MHFPNPYVTKAKLARITSERSDVEPSRLEGDSAGHLP